MNDTLVKQFEEENPNIEQFCGSFYPQYIEWLEKRLFKVIDDQSTPNCTHKAPVIKRECINGEHVSVCECGAIL